MSNILDSVNQNDANLTEEEKKKKEEEQKKKEEKKEWMIMDQNPLSAWYVKLSLKKLKIFVII